MSDWLQPEYMDSLKNKCNNKLIILRKVRRIYFSFFRLFDPVFLRAVFGGDYKFFFRYLMGIFAVSLFEKL